MSETDLPEEAITNKPGNWNLEQILREKSLYDQNLNFEKDPEAVVNGWSLPCPEKSSQPEDSNQANVLSVVASKDADLIVASFVNNTLGFWHASGAFTKGDQGLIRGSRNILSSTIAGDYLITSKMDGFVDFHQLSSGNFLFDVKAHSSYTVQVISTWDQERLVVATAGWDSKASIFCVSPSASLTTQPETQQEAAAEPVVSLEKHSAVSNVQSLLFARHPDSGDLYLVYTRRDSIHLHYLLLTPTTSPDGQTGYTSTPAGRQSLAPQQHSTWTSFTPAHLEPCPTDPTLVAVATSHTPSMKLIITRLLFPDGLAPPITTAPSAPGSATHGTKDELAIRVVVNTNAPQNDYSTPRCVWRPDGSGVWVSGDDGVVRGIDAITGKVVKELRGHEPGTKIRCLWAGMLAGQSSHEEEVLISGGFDKNLLVWTAT